MMGDSTDTDHFGSSPGTGVVTSLNNGYMALALMDKPRLTYEAWPQDTQSYQAGSPWVLGNRWIDGGPGAVPGAPIPYVESRLDYSKSMSPDIYFNGLTVNTSNLPNAASRLIAVFAEMQAVGSYIIACTMKPVEAGSTYDDANYRANHLPNNAALRVWAAEQGPDKVLLIDWSVLMDPGLTGYCTVPGLLYDGIHPDDFGADVLAAYCNSRLDLITETGDDIFEWRWNNLVNHIPNPIFNSEDTALPAFSRTGNWLSGSVGPRGFRGQAMGSTASQMISSLAANPETGGNKILLPITVAAGALASEGWTLQPRIDASTNGFVPAPQLAGKTVVFGMEIEVPEGDYFATGNLIVTDNAATSNRSVAMDTTANSLTSRRVSKAQRMKLMTPPLKLDAASGGPRCNGTAKIRGLAAQQAGVTSLDGMAILRVALWDVGDPKVRYHQA